MSRAIFEAATISPFSFLIGETVREISTRLSVLPLSNRLVVDSFASADPFEDKGFFVLSIHWDKDRHWPSHRLLRRIAKEELRATIPSHNSAVEILGKDRVVRRFNDGRVVLSGALAPHGLLLGGIGIGALVGAYFLPWLGHRLGPNRLVALGTVGTALSLLLYGLAHEPFVALGASLLAGISWICVLSTLNVSAQVALPEWVRARGLAVFVVFLFGALTLGSVLWGYLAGLIGLSYTNFVAAAGILVALPLTWRWKLLTALGADLAPSMHWPAPIAVHDVEADQGPVMVTVEYRIDPKDRRQFLQALDRVERERRRDGAYAWCVFEDAAEEGRMIETFLVESWTEHLRQHERVTNADRLIEEKVLHFDIHGPPRVTHLIAADADRVHVKKSPK
jgi:hypothetical protein